MIFRYWSPAWETPPYSRWIGDVVDHLSPGQRVDLTDLDLEPELVALLDRGAGAVAGDRQQQASHRANLLRWSLLHRRGGVWLDHDVIPFVDVTELERPWIAVVAAPPVKPAGVASLGFVTGDQAPHRPTGELVSCAIGMDAGDELAAAMLDVALAAAAGDRAAAYVSGDAILNGWARPHDGTRDRPHELARSHFASLVPLAFAADGAAGHTEGNPPMLLHLWHHRR